MAVGTVPIQDQFDGLGQETFNLRQSFFGGEWNDAIREDLFDCPGSNVVFTMDVCSDTFTNSGSKF
jgi:hypothetical protein